MLGAQFSGAFVDNVLRGAAVALATFGGVRPFGLDGPGTAVVTGVALILPFALLSGIGGELADAVDRGALVRWIKAIEVPIVAGCAAALIAGRVDVLLVGLGVLGARSALFGSVKYAILPDLVDEARLTAANGLVQASTWLAILLGAIAGVGAVGSAHASAMASPVGVGAMAILVSLRGAASAWSVPAVPRAADRPVRRDPIATTIAAVRYAAAVPNVFQAILGKAWFWALGGVLIAELATFTRDVVHGSPAVEMVWLACMAVGAGLGAVLADRLSRQRVELGIVPMGSVGLSVFAVGIAFGGAVGSRALIALSFVGIGLAGAVFAVPLAAYVQWRAAPAVRAHVIAGANAIDAVAMVGTTVIWGLARHFGVGPLGSFVAIAAVNAAVAVYIYTRVPEFLLRFVAWCLSNVLYRLEVTGLEHIPVDGPCVIVCNHITFVDWLIVGGAVRRPVRFVMYAGYQGNPLFRFITSQARVIPIVGAKEDPEMLKRAMDAVSRELDDGWVVGIFPEGHLTADGQIAPFRAGIERIIARNPVPVIPLALNGLWGSWFSREGGAAMRGAPRRFWSHVWLTASEPIPAEAVTAKVLEEAVTALWHRRPDAP